MHPTVICYVEIPQGKYCNWDPDPKNPGSRREWCVFWQEDFCMKTKKWTDEQGRVHYKREGEMAGFCRLHKGETEEEQAFGKYLDVDSGRPAKCKDCLRAKQTDEFIVSTMK